MPFDLIRLEDQPTKVLDGGARDCAIGVLIVEIAFNLGYEARAERNTTSARRGEAKRSEAKRSVLPCKL